MLATAGMKLAPLLSVIRRSYLKRPPAVRRHCPPTNGVFATFLTGPAPQATVPTMVSSLVVRSDSRLASGLAGSALRFKISEATSKSAWIRRGAGHPRGRALWLWAGPSGAAVSPDRDDLKGWGGHHQPSVKILSPAVPSASTDAGKSSALPTVAIFGL